VGRKQMPWFRFYTEAPNDRKVRRLSPSHRWVWVCVLAAARQSPEPGRLLVSDGVPMTVADLADYAGVTHKVAKAALEGMQKVGLTAQDGRTLVVPAWHERQYQSDTSTDRVRQHRSRNIKADGDIETFHNRSSNGDGTFLKRSKEQLRNAPETETETDTEGEHSRDDYAGSSEPLTDGKARRVLARLRASAHPDSRERLAGEAVAALPALLADFDAPDDVLVSYLLGEGANLKLYRRTE